MRKKISLLILLLSLGLSGCTQRNPAVPALNIYTYQSLAAEYGLLPLITEKFSTDHNVTLNIVPFPDTGAMINQLIVEKNNPTADLVLGIDNLDVARYAQDQLWSKPVAFDYGHVGFVYDTTQLTFTEPISLSTLANDPTYRDKIILEQPGLSSTGNQLLHWAETVFGDETADFWQALEQQTLTVTPDWNTAYYTMFLNGEAPIVLSYLTSPAYHIDQESSYRYAALPISDGYVQQTEYIAIVTGTSQATLAQAFQQYLLSDVVQNQVAQTQWMWPISSTATVPPAFQVGIKPTAAQTLSLPDDLIASNYQAWLQDWQQVFTTPALQ